MFKYTQNLHTHTTFCDGLYSPEKIINKAIEIGFDSIGFSGHAYTCFLDDYCMSEQNTEAYIKEINLLKQKYLGKIKVYLGTEYDYYSSGSLAPYDYVIGAIHYVETVDGILSIDARNPEKIKSIINGYFEGKPLNLVKEYYRLLGDLPNKLDRVDIIAHFDLLLKSSEIEKIFDTEDKLYRNYASEAIENIVKKGCLFEVNTGAVARGIRSLPYIEGWALKLINELKGKVVISSDCHKIEYLDYYFEQAIEYIKSNGFTSVYTFEDGEFIPHKI